jgi:hypothetical protein
MNEFILVWVLMTFDYYRGHLTYSPPVKTMEDCQRMQQFTTEEPKSLGRAERTKCIQISVLKNTK